MLQFGMVRGRLSLRHKPIEWSEARTPLCCALWQPHMRRTANFQRRLELHGPRCNSRECTARTLLRRISFNRSRCTDSGCRTGTRRNSGGGEVIESVNSALRFNWATIYDVTWRKPQLSQLVTQDFENVCALDNTLQRIGSGTAAECNDIFNGDQRRFCVNRRRLGLFLCRFFGFGRVLVHR